MLILGIETSCDETAISVVENGRKIFSNVVASSLYLHKRYGGVVPEIATRYHVELITLVLAGALHKARVSLRQLDAVACVYGPGLVGALLIGLSLAKALSLALHVPLVGVNHLQAHIYAALMSGRPVPFPFVGLVVSGGHTNLFYVRNFLQWQILGATRDDAAGEAFDKVAKILKLGYPGGPVIEKEARKARAAVIKFPRTCLKDHSLDFSFSGLKTAVLYYVKEHSIRNSQYAIRNIAAGFQEAVVDSLAERAACACRLKGAGHFVAGGGVVMNLRLRALLRKVLNSQGVNVYFPRSGLCQDNAAMVAGLAYQLYRQGIVSNLNLEPQPNLV